MVARNRNLLQWGNSAGSNHSKRATKAIFNSYEKVINISSFARISKIRNYQENVENYRMSWQIHLERQVYINNHEK